MSLSLPDLETATQVYGWLTTNDPSVPLPAISVGVPVRFPGPAVLHSRITATLGLPRRRVVNPKFAAWDDDPPGWSQDSPLPMLLRWAAPVQADPYPRIRALGDPDVSARVGDLGLAMQSLSEARHAARLGSRDRKQLKQLAEAVSALSGAAMTEYRDTRSSLGRWVDAWEPAEPPQPVFATTNKRGNSWR